MRRNVIEKRPLTAALLALSGSLLLLGPSALHAETLEELDAISDLSMNEAAGIAAAKEQGTRGAYLEALATLERVLAVHPTSREARLIHAVYLCEIDDPQGGLRELGELEDKHYGESLLNEARSRCQNRPAGEGQIEIGQGN